MEVAEATERRVMDRQRGSLLFRLRKFAPNIFHTWQKSKIPFLIQLLRVNPLQIENPSVGQPCQGEHIYHIRHRLIPIA